MIVWSLELFKVPLLRLRKITSFRNNIFLAPHFMLFDLLTKPKKWSVDAADCLYSWTK